MNIHQPEPVELPPSAKREIGTMGSAVSASPVHLPEWMGLFHSMKLEHHEVKTFYELFRAVPIDDLDCIRVSQLLDYLEVGHSMFAEKLFAVFDKTYSDKVDFFEFVVSLWKFCALREDSIVNFTFDLYDIDDDEVMTEMEVKVMFHDLLHCPASQPTESETSRILLEELLSLNEEVITLGNFRHFCRHHEKLLKPIYALQDKLQVAVMGRPFWKAMSERQVILGEGRQFMLGDLMVKPSNRDLFHQLLHDDSSGGLRAMMKSLFEGVQHTLHPSKAELSECATQDASLQRIFAP